MGSNYIVFVDTVMKFGFTVMGKKVNALFFIDCLSSRLMEIVPFSTIGDVVKCKHMKMVNMLEHLLHTGHLPCYTLKSLFGY